MPSGGQPPQPGWQDIFLDALARTHMITASLAEAGVGRTYVYDQRKKDPQFAERWAEVVEKDTEVLEQIAVNRAASGSDNLLQFLLKARRPEVYRENVRHEHQHQVNGELSFLPGGQQPIQIQGAKRREAARLLQEAAREDAEVIEGRELPDEAA